MLAHQISVDDYLRGLDNSSREYRVSDRRKKQALKHLKIVHADDDGFITVAVKDKGKWQQHHFKKEELMEKLEKIIGLELDSYISVNSFYVPVRKSGCVRHINSLYIDLDKHDSKKISKQDVESVIYTLEEDYFGYLVPHPSLIIVTGRGLQLYWVLEHLPKQAVPLWLLIENEMVSVFKDFNVRNVTVDESCTDISRVFRIAGSKNTKSNTLASIYFANENNVYRLDELIEGYFPHYQILKKKNKKTNNQKENKVKRLHTLYNLNYARLNDIIKLQELRGGACDGIREIMCFLYRYYSCLYAKDTEKALQDTLEFNNTFTNPLPESDVIAQTKSAEKAFKIYYESIEKGINLKTKDLGVYNYTNTKLIKILKITELEQQQLESIIGTKEKYRRNNTRRTPRNEAGLTKREQDKESKINNINKLKEQGLNNTEIAKELSISVRYVRKILNNKK